MNTTTETQVNIPLLRKAVEWAEAEHAKGIRWSRWEQAMWVTTPQDQERARRAPEDERGGWYKLAAQRDPECGTCYCIAGYLLHEVEGVPEDRAVGYVNRAAALLGIARVQGDALFDAENSIEDVRRIAEQIAGERL